MLKNMIMVEGIDCSGKGVIVAELAALASEKGMRVFDIREYERKHNTHPNFKVLAHCDAIVTTEPTYAGIGKEIRETLIRTGSVYDPIKIAEAYSKDRLRQYKDLLLRFAQSSHLIIQERGVLSSLIYQPVHASLKGLKHPSREEIMLLEGNSFCINNPPEFLLIASLSSLTANRRLKSRQKCDDSLFEKLDFQEQVQKEYESQEIFSIFASQGSKVEYINTDDPNTVVDVKNKVRQWWNANISINS